MSGWENVLLYGRRGAVCN